MRLLIIEDEPQLAALIKSGLDREGFFCDVSLTAEDGVEKQFSFEYDVVLLDLNLPDMDGLEVLRTFRAHHFDVPVIVVSARGEARERGSALDLGADDYLVKPFDFSELCARIRAVVRRSYGRSDSRIAIGKVTIAPTERRVLYDGKEVDFSAKELDILEYLAMNHPHMVSAADISEHVYGEEFDMNSSVLRVHFANIRRKFATVTNEPIIETMKGRGYRFAGKTKG